jgi:serine/threonine-protein kinase
MVNQLFFDPQELAKGKFFGVDGKIETDEGRSYELEDWIDRGGNASVYRCRESGTGEVFAIKFLMNDNLRNVKRFLREVKLLKQLGSEHVIQYRGAGRVKVTNHKRERIPFLVMELADCNLQKMMQQEGRPLDYARYAGQFRGLAQALSLLHEVAVHRDIKPENILVVGERWLLSDYGLCSYVAGEAEDLTRDGQNLGPKYWLSPEAHNRRLGCGDTICAASDVYQLASIYWYVATGRQPCGIVTESDWNGPDKLFSLLQRSLFHDRTKRPQNGGEFFHDLETALSL